MRAALGVRPYVQPSWVKCCHTRTHSGELLRSLLAVCSIVRSFDRCCALTKQINERTAEITTLVGDSNFRDEPGSGPYALACSGLEYRAHRHAGSPPDPTYFRNPRNPTNTSSRCPVPPGWGLSLADSGRAPVRSGWTRRATYHRPLRSRGQS